jgi:hypothetical protein
VIAAGIEQWLDVGKVQAFADDSDGHPTCQDLWFDSWGLGLSAQILAKRNRDQKASCQGIPLINRIYRDKLVYMRAGLSSWTSSTPSSRLVGRARFAAEIRVDDQLLKLDAINDIVVKGTLLYGGDWIFAPEGKPDDGKFEVIIVKNSADWGAAAIASHKRNPVTGDDLEVLGLPRRVIPSGRRIEVRVTRPRACRRCPRRSTARSFAPPTTTASRTSTTTCASSCPRTRTGCSVRPWPAPSPSPSPSRRPPATRPGTSATSSASACKRASSPTTSPTPRAPRSRPS